MKKRMLDLFCGRLGWSKAFLARGWECVGVDLVKPPQIPPGFRFVKYNLLGLRFQKFPCPHFDTFGDAPNPLWETTHFDFICCSSPCQEFSTMRNFRPPVPYPELGIKLFNHAQQICEASGVPYIMENVAGAGRFVGQAVNHCGSYYLWGNAVPPILPQNIRKGMTQLAMGFRERKGEPGWNNRHGQCGQTPTELVATIPPELASCVADYAERLLEQKSGSSIAKAGFVDHGLVDRGTLCLSLTTSCEEQFG